MATGMKGLMLWCKKMTEGYSDVSITNMTSSFRDGLAFCAIIHHFRPDLIDFSKLSKENIAFNNGLAFRVAEEELDIPALLDVEDMVAMPVPDKLSIMTYASQYYNYFKDKIPGDVDVRRVPSKKRHTPEQSDVIPAKRTLPKTESATGNQAPAQGSASACESCGRSVYLMERFTAEGKLFHRVCFTCLACGSQLKTGTYRYDQEIGNFFCEQHFKERGDKRYKSCEAEKVDAEKSFTGACDAQSVSGSVGSSPAEFVAVSPTAMSSPSLQAGGLQAFSNPATSSPALDAGVYERDRATDLPPSRLFVRNQGAIREGLRPLSTPASLDWETTGAVTIKSDPEIMRSPVHAKEDAARTCLVNAIRKKSKDPVADFGSTAYHQRLESSASMHLLNGHVVDRNEASPSAHGGFDNQQTHIHDGVLKAERNGGDHCFLIDPVEMDTTERQDGRFEDINNFRGSNLEQIGSTNVMCKGPHQKKLVLKKKKKETGVGPKNVAQVIFDESTTSAESFRCDPQSEVVGLREPLNQAVIDSCESEGPTAWQGERREPVLVNSSSRLRSLQCLENVPLDRTSAAEVNHVSSNASGTILDVARGPSEQSPGQETIWEYPQASTRLQCRGKQADVKAAEPAPDDIGATAGRGLDFDSRTSLMKQPVDAVSLYEDGVAKLQRAERDDASSRSPTKTDRKQSQSPIRPERGPHPDVSPPAEKDRARVADESKRILAQFSSTVGEVIMEENGGELDLRHAEKDDTVQMQTVNKLPDMQVPVISPNPLSGRNMVLPKPRPRVSRPTSCPVVASKDLGSEKAGQSVDLGNVQSISKNRQAPQRPPAIRKESHQEAPEETVSSALSSVQKRPPAPRPVPPQRPLAPYTSESTNATVSPAKKDERLSRVGEYSPDFVPLSSARPTEPDSSKSGHERLVAGTDSKVVNRSHRVDSPAKNHVPSPIALKSVPPGPGSKGAPRRPPPPPPLPPKHHRHHEESSSNQKRASHPARPAPPLWQVGVDSGMGTNVKLREHQPTRVEIKAELACLEQQQRRLESEGVLMEKKLRGSAGGEPEEGLLAAWFDLVNQKNKLLRRENELIYMVQELDFLRSQRKAELELRQLMSKPESEKSVADRAREESLLASMLDFVQRRSDIVDQMDEDRLREYEEDRELQAMREEAALSKSHAKLLRSVSKSKQKEPNKDRKKKK